MYEKELTYKIRGAIFEVYRTLGAGFLEKVYHQALVRELTLQGLEVKTELALPVYYKKALVGEYRADLIVQDSVLVEIKAQKNLSPAAEAQIINYLKTTGIKVGLLVNFTYPKATVKRIVY